MTISTQSNMGIIINPNKEVVEKILKALKENNGYCPCALL